MSPELREKAKACTSTEELIALADEEGVELSTEELDAIAGGDVDWTAGLCTSKFG